MTKVEIFSTLDEANQQLQSYLTKNIEVRERVFNEVNRRCQTYKESAVFKRRNDGEEEAVLAKNGALELSRGIGRGEAVTSFVKLYALDQNLYGFDYTVFDLDNNVKNIPHWSMDELAAAVREQLEEEQTENFDLKNSPLFYTVEEPFTYSGQQKQKIKNSEQYGSLALEDRLFLDQFLDCYAERGLTTVEIKGFINSYVQFLN
ncbi:MAG: hypothetical protein AABY40_00465 [Nanoarchaeota archaeon]